MTSDSQPVARILALRSVSLLVADPDAAIDFYADRWGLTVVERRDGEAWLRGTSEEHHILHIGRAEANRLGKVTFAVATRPEVDLAAERLRSRGVPVVAGPGELDRPGGGYGVSFADPEGRVFELAAEVGAVVKQHREAEAVPHKLAHVVLNTVDINAAAAWMVDVLGLRISDWSEHQMTFLRCNREHHVIAFNQAEWTSLNHVAYEMASLDHYLRGIGRLHRAGHDPRWGPGRHGPGDNTFAYYTDPAGLVCEYTSEVEQIDESTWLPRVWARTPELSDQWGFAGPPSAEVRSHMAGVPDAGAGTGLESPGGI